VSEPDDDPWQWLTNEEVFGWNPEPLPGTRAGADAAQLDDLRLILRNGRLGRYRVVDFACAPAPAGPGPQREDRRVELRVTDATARARARGPTRRNRRGEEGYPVLRRVRVHRHLEDKVGAE